MYSYILILDCFETHPAWYLMHFDEKENFVPYSSPLPEPVTNQY